MASVSFKKPHLYMREALQEPLATTSTGYAQSRSQRIGQGTSGGNNGSTDMMMKPYTGTGIHNVGIPLPLVLEVAVAGSGSSYSRIGQFDGMHRVGSSTR